MASPYPVGSTAVLVVVVEGGGRLVDVVVDDDAGCEVVVLDDVGGADVVVVVLVGPVDVVVVDSRTLARPDSGTSLPVNRPGSWNEPR
jgi:hypothetical protein